VAADLAAPADLSTPDLGARDLAVADLATAPDLAATAPDLAATVPDLAATVDLSPVPDLTAPADLRRVDLAHNPAGPWPVADLRIYDGTAGLGTNVIDASPDEAQNLWAVTPDALYLLRPGDPQFHRYTASDGLHIQGFVDPLGNPNTTWITAVAGGLANQVFVGYYGYESDDRFADSLAQKELGQADRIALNTDGTIGVTRYLFPCDNQAASCWEDRSVRRLLFAHDGAAAGHLFLGMDHGVVHEYGDSIGDHIHVETWWHYDGGVTEKVGEQYGLAVLPSGDLWTAGAYGVGLQTWNPVPHFAWVAEPYKEAFTVYTGDHGLDVQYGYREDQRGVAVTSDGTVWFASFDRGLASWNMATPHNYNSTMMWTSTPGLPTSQLTDIAADPDGTLWIVNWDGGLYRFDPKANSAQLWPGVGDVKRVVVDTTVVPRAVYVSMASGLAVIRAK
jgi:hypothetical protein